MMYIALNITTLLSLFIISVLCSFFLITKKGNRTENKILVALLFLFSLQIIYSYMVSVYACQYFMAWHKSIFILRQTALLMGPCIYFYLCAFSQKNDILKKKNLSHFLPFAAAVMIVSFYIATDNNFIIWKSKIDLYDTIFILLYNLLYILLSIFKMKSLDITFSSFVKNVQNSSHRIMLQILLLGFIAVWIINLNSFTIYAIVQNPDVCAYSVSIFTLVIFIFLSTIMFLLLLKPEIHYVIEKYKNSPIDENTKNEYLQRLDKYMKSQKPFLDPEISLEGIAKELSINPRIISQIINESFRKNFRSYINGFRIQESMQRLSEIENSKKTVLEILYDVGFNSKSVFNDEFKKFTGLTPQEYRIKHQSGLPNELFTVDSFS
jgi:AraC-like DNA-binding protein